MLFSKFLVTVTLLASISWLTGANPVDRRQLGWKTKSCPAFSSFTTVDKLPPYWPVFIDPYFESDADPGLRKRHDDGHDDGEGRLALMARAPNRPLAQTGAQILATALKAGHVMVVVAGAGAPELVLAGYSVAQTIFNSRPLGFQTDHILPVSMPYLFVRSLPNGLQRANLERLLPLDGSSTVSRNPFRHEIQSSSHLDPLQSFTESLRAGIFNAPCNLMLVPGWINQVMGALVATDSMPKRSRFDVQAAGFIQDYMSKIHGYYFNSVYIVSRALATAAHDPDVQRLFTAYCSQQFSKVAAFVAGTDGWTGPALETVLIAPDGQIVLDHAAGQLSINDAVCRGRCLVSINATDSASNGTMNSDGDSALSTTSPLSDSSFSSLGQTSLSSSILPSSSLPTPPASPTGFDILATDVSFDSSPGQQTWKPMSDVPAPTTTLSA